MQEMNYISKKNPHLSKDADFSIATVISFNKRQKDPKDLILFTILTSSTGVLQTLDEGWI